VLIFPATSETKQTPKVFYFCSIATIPIKNIDGLIFLGSLSKILCVIRLYDTAFMLLIQYFIYSSRPNFQYSHLEIQPPLYLSCKILHEDYKRQNLFHRRFLNGMSSGSSFHLPIHRCRQHRIVGVDAYQYGMSSGSSFHLPIHRCRQHRIVGVNAYP
jgi:hypothetical protein